MVRRWTVASTTYLPLHRELLGRKERAHAREPNDGTKGASTAARRRSNAPASSFYQPPRSLFGSTSSGGSNPSSRQLAANRGDLRCIKEEPDGGRWIREASFPLTATSSPSDPTPPTSSPVAHGADAVYPHPVSS
jgi:hypothetical protein